MESIYSKNFGLKYVKGVFPDYEFAFKQQPDCRKKSWFPDSKYQLISILNKRLISSSRNLDLKYGTKIKCLHYAYAYMQILRHSFIKWFWAQRTHSLHINQTSQLFKYSGAFLSVMHFTFLWPIWFPKWKNHHQITSEEIGQIKK